MGLTGGVKSHRLSGQILPYREKKTSLALRVLRAYVLRSISDVHNPILLEAAIFRQSRLYSLWRGVNEGPALRTLLCFVFVLASRHASGIV